MVQCGACHTTEQRKEAQDRGYKMNIKDKEMRDRIKRVGEIMSGKKFKVRKNALWKSPKTDEKGRYGHTYKE